MSLVFIWSGSSGSSSGTIDNGVDRSKIDDNPGTVSITTLTTERVQGTFLFRMRDSVDPTDNREITEGSFDVRFSNY